MSKARTNNPTEVPGFSKPPADISPALRRYLESITEALDIRLGRRGDARDRAITLRELIDSGLAVELGNNPFNVSAAPPPPPPPPPANGTPTAPTNFSANGGYSIITCFWDYPNYGPHSHTEIWRHTADVIGDAQLVGISSGISFIDPVGGGKTYYYWARHVSLYDIQGPFQAANGDQAVTAVDVDALLAVLTGAITESQLYSTLGARINLIDGPSTLVNSVSARIKAETDARIAAINQEASTRAQALINEANARGTAINNEANTRSSADENLAQQITTVSSVTNTKNRIYRQNEAPTTGLVIGDLWFDADNDNKAYRWTGSVWDPTDDLRIAANTAAIQNEILARTNGDLAEASQRETFAAQIRGNYTGTDLSQLSSGLLYSERQTRASQTSALSQRADALEATVNNPITGVNATSSLVTTLNTEVFPNGNTSASRIDGLESTVNDANTGVAATATVVSALKTEVFPNGTASASRIDGLESIVNDANTGVAATATVVSALKTEVFPNGTASASRIDGLESTVNNPTTGVAATASIVDSLKTEVFPNGTASASRIDGLEATVNNPTTGVAATASTVSLLTTEIFPNGTAQASYIDQVNAAVGTNTAAIQSEATARANADGTLFGQYTVKVDLNGYVSGFGLASTVNNATPSSEFIVRADRFSIASPGQTTIIPFIVQTSPTTINGVPVDPGVYITDAVIRNGTITTAKIGLAQIDDARIASISAAKISTGSLDAARITVDNVTLDSYYDGSIGRNRLYIPDLGVKTAKIDNLAVTNGKIDNLAVSTLKIAGNAITQPEVYTAADVYIPNDSSAAIQLTNSGVNESYNYVGAGNGDYSYVLVYVDPYTYEPYYGYDYVGTGNGDYVRVVTYSAPTFTGAITVIETPVVTVGVDSTAAVQVVYYATHDGSIYTYNDSGQHLFMLLDTGSGYRLVAQQQVGLRTDSSADTMASLPIAMTFTARNITTARVKILTGSRRVDLPMGNFSNACWLRNSTISLLGAKR